MKLACRTALGLGVVLSALLGGFQRDPLSAQAKPPLTLVSLAEIPRILDPQLSPDGRFVTFTLMRAGWKANRQIGHIWRQAVDGGAPVQLTKGDAGEANARWSPDGRSLLYLAPGPPAACSCSWFQPAAATRVS